VQLVLVTSALRSSPKVNQQPKGHKALKEQAWLCISN